MALAPNLASIQSLTLSAGIKSTPPFILAICRASKALPSTARHFWWGRCGYRGRCSSGTAAYHKSLEAQSRIEKCKSGKPSVTLHPPGYPVYYKHGYGWRLASSYGKSGQQLDEVPTHKSKEDAAREAESTSENEKWQEDLNRRLDRIRERVENYPYESIFGASIRNGVWNPWDTKWGKLIRTAGWRDLAGSKETQDKPQFEEAMSWAWTSQGLGEGSKHSSEFGLNRNASSEDGDIDLITLRRVPRKSSKADANGASPSGDTELNIPLKTLSSSKDGTPDKNSSKEAAGAARSSPKLSESNTSVKTEVPLTQTPEHHSKSPKNWLAKEGFSEIVKTSSEFGKRHEANTGTVSSTTDKQSPKLESSLERHLWTVGPPTWEPMSPRPSLIYKTEEDRTEDVDLLRASIIRATSGRLKRPAQEAAETRSERRKALQATFEKRQRDLEERYAAEVIPLAATESRRDIDQSSADGNTHHHNSEPSLENEPPVIDGLNLNKISAEDPPANVDAWGYDFTPKGLETSYQDELDNKIQSLESYYARRQQEVFEAEEQRVLQKRKAAESALADEIKNQKAAMLALENRPRSEQPAGKEHYIVPYGEGDISSNISDFTGLDRWYKRKAPHATKQDEQKVKDIHLVREIRQIYEERYGTITTKHRQDSESTKMLGKSDQAVQEGLRNYDEKMAADTKIPVKTAQITSSHYNYSMEGREDPGVQDGLCEFDVRQAEGNSTCATKGKIASTDLDSREIELLSTTAEPSSPASPSPIPSRTRLETALERSAKVAEKSSSLVTQVSHEARPGASAKPDSIVSLTSTSKPAAMTYKILALDKTTDSVITATTTSSLHESSSPPRSASSILSHLENPAKYFDHFEPLEAAGYELAAGSRTSLIFKKVRDEDHDGVKAMQAGIKSFLQETSAPTARTDISQGNSDIQEQSKANKIVDRQVAAPSEANKDTKAADISRLVSSPESVDKPGKEHTVGTPSNAHFPPTSFDMETPLKVWSAPPDERAEYLIQQGRQEAAEREHSEHSNLINPIDGTTAGAASAPGSEVPNEAPTQASYATTAPSNKTYIRREEEVFSGRNVTREQYRERKRQHRLATHAYRDQQSRGTWRRIWRTIRRILATGALVSACFFLVGALLEEVYRPRRERRREREERGKENARRWGRSGTANN